jgi:hypothetical protein
MGFVRGNTHPKIGQKDPENLDGGVLRTIQNASHSVRSIIQTRMISSKFLPSLNFTGDRHPIEAT